MAPVRISADSRRGGEHDAVRRCPAAARGRRIVTLLLLFALIAAVPLAAASPPDPTWIPGVYDSADLDDVVLAVISADAALNPAATAPALWRAGERAVHRAHSPVREARPRVTADRSPPLRSI